MACPGEAYVAAQARRRELTRAWAAWLDEHRLTALLEPTIPVVAPLRGDGLRPCRHRLRADLADALLGLDGVPRGGAPGGCRAQWASRGRVADRPGRRGLGAAVARHRPAGASSACPSHRRVTGSVAAARTAHRMAAVAYDYVIVGAGSAGCVLAARLGEDPDVRVAVIEAGPPDTDPGDPHAVRVRRAPEEPGRLGPRHRAGAGARTAAVPTCRAAACSAARARSTR